MVFPICLPGEEPGHAFGLLFALLAAAGVVTSAYAWRARAARDRLVAALEHMSQGVAMFDRRQRLIVCNQRYLVMFDLSAELVRPGTTLRRIMELRIERRSLPGPDRETFIQQRLAVADANQPAKHLVESNDGKIFAVNHQPTPDRGWLVTFEDISDRVHAEGELKQTRASLTEARAEAERAAAMAKAAHEHLLQAFDIAPQGLVMFDRDDRYVMWNRRYAELFISGEDVLLPGMSFEHYLRARLARGEPAEAVGREEEWLEAQLARHRASRSDGELLLSNGRWVRIEEQRTADGGAIGIRTDITALKQREASFKLLFESNPVPMWVFDRQTHRFLAVNEAAVTFYGYSRNAFIEMSVGDIEERLDDAEPTRSLLFRSADGRASAGQAMRHVKADQSRIEVVAYSQSLEYEGRPAALVAVMDVTERRRAEQRVAHLALHDPLTDLWNRAAFNAELDARLSQARQHGSTFAVLCIDLDHFKEANDVFGHAVGDQLLVAIARRFETASIGAFLARIGGDEFVLISSLATQSAGASLLAGRLLATVTEPFEIMGHRLRLGLSIGVALYPQDGTDATALLSNADAALYRAKAEGRLAAKFFVPDMDRRLRDRLALQQDLRSAIEQNQLFVHYQPQSTIDGRIFGFEALARWRHPVLGLVSPQIFIPLAEQNGTIDDIGEWVLREACREAASWRKPLKISVNLSPVQFRHGDLPERIHAILLDTGLSARRLELEITEGVLIQDPPRVLSILRRLKSIGPKISMDDFGTGYSSLSSLQSFPFDTIKIDRTFISGVGESGQSSAIVRAVLSLGRALDMPVIAEGVETEEQRAFLKHEGCERIQGNLIGRPGSPDQYADVTGVYGRPRIASLAG